MEFYWGYANYEDSMKLVEEMFNYIAKQVYGKTVFTTKRDVSSQISTGEDSPDPLVLAPPTFQPMRQVNGEAQEFGVNKGKMRAAPAPIFVLKKRVIVIAGIEPEIRPGHDVGHQHPDGYHVRGFVHR